MLFPNINSKVLHLEPFTSNNDAFQSYEKIVWTDWLRKGFQKFLFRFLPTQEHYRYDENDARRGELCAFSEYEVQSSISLFGQ